MEVSARALFGVAAGVAALFALVAGVIDHRHRTRRDMDRVAMLDWRSVQVFALMAAILLAAIAFHL